MANFGDQGLHAGDGEAAALGNRLAKETTRVRRPRLDMCGVIRRAERSRQPGRESRRLQPKRARGSEAAPSAPPVRGDQAPAGGGEQ